MGELRTVDTIFKSELKHCKLENVCCNFQIDTETISTYHIRIFFGNFKIRKVMTDPCRLPCCVLSYFSLVFVMDQLTNPSHKSQLGRAIN